MVEKANVYINNTKTISLEMSFIYLLLRSAVVMSLNAAVKYLLLTEFEGRTVSYGPSFFLLDLWPKRKARGP